jgi:hypothetical protein
MKLGITGQRKYENILKIKDVLEEYKLNYGKDLFIIVGGCIGADAIAANIATSMMIHVHTVLPYDMSKVDPYWETFCSSYEKMPEGTTYKDRNVKIVTLSEELVAFVSEPEFIHGEITRSGTWQTVRLAKRKKIKSIIIGE